MFTTYILWSKIRQIYYVGSTDNLERRIIEHNGGRSVFTKTGIPWKVVYVQEYPTRREAQQREREIKKRKSRVYIERLIDGSERPVSP